MDSASSYIMEKTSKYGAKVRRKCWLRIPRTTDTEIVPYTKIFSRGLLLIHFSFQAVRSSCLPLLSR